MQFRVHWVYFSLAFAVGLLCCQMLAPEPSVVLKFPSPYNAGLVTYDNDNGDDDCFKYDAEIVECPDDISLIRKQPRQEDSL